MRLLSSSFRNSSHVRTGLRTLAGWIYSRYSTFMHTGGRIYNVHVQDWVYSHMIVQCRVDLKFLTNKFSPIIHVHDCLGCAVLLCVCLTLLASFFHLSLVYMYIHVHVFLSLVYMYIHVHVLMREGRSKQGQTNNKVKQHSTPKAVTFPKKNDMYTSPAVS